MARNALICSFFCQLDKNETTDALAMIFEKSFFFFSIFSPFQGKILLLFITWKCIFASLWIQRWKFIFSVHPLNQKTKKKKKNVFINIIMPYSFYVCFFSFSLKRLLFSCYLWALRRLYSYLTKWSYHQSAQRSGTHFIYMYLYIRLFSGGSDLW